MGTFECKGEGVFEIMDPIDEKNSLHEPKPKAVYAAVQRSFVIDSGASYHLIGYKQLTSSERGAIRPIGEPYRIQSANGIVIVDRGKNLCPCSEHIGVGPTDARLPTCLVPRETMFETGLDLSVAERKETDVV